MGLVFFFFFLILPVICSGSPVLRELMMAFKTSFIHWFDNCYWVLTAHFLGARYHDLGCRNKSRVCALQEFHIRWHWSVVTYLVKALLGSTARGTVLVWFLEANQSMLKEINTEYSLEGLMLKLKFQYFGHPMGRANSMEKSFPW